MYYPDSFKKPETRQRQTSRCSRFSMIELLMSMSVLSIMMLLLFRYINTAQTTWQRNDSRLEMIDSQRVVLDIIERDLNCAVASSLLDQEIGFYVPDPAQDGFVAAFVASVPFNNGASRLCEIYYKVEDNSLKRMVVVATSVDWDFFGKTELSEPTWVVNPDSTYETILQDGVKELNMSFFVAQADAVPIGSGTVIYELPQRADIELVLFDPHLPNPTAANLLLTQSAFMRILYLNKLIGR